MTRQNVDKLVNANTLSSIKCDTRTHIWVNSKLYFQHVNFCTSVKIIGDKNGLTLWETYINKLTIFY